MVIWLSPANSQCEFAPNSQYCEFQAEFGANSRCERIRSEFGEFKLNSLRICIPNYAMVIVCRLTGYILAIPCRQEGLTSHKAAALFLHYCAFFTGMPRQIHSNNQCIISSEFFNALCLFVFHFSISCLVSGLVK